MGAGSGKPCGVGRRPALVEANALWLVPGLDHPVYAQFARFFRALFRHFEPLDYRAAYLDRGLAAVKAEIESAVGNTQARIIIYSQFPSTYAYLQPEFLRSLAERATVV